ncbi:MAG TPA: YicC/YloC family endoribonuclease [Candidatus Acidoferrales bacterium]|nr:YicC/YloC family endoribonuclease [Candidatus Acidoferrales bacterium]
MTPTTTPRADAKTVRGAGVKSMTGFAEARVEHAGWALRVSLRSVNHRFLDLHLRLPEGFEALEPEIRRVLREKLKRGHVDVNLRVDPIGAASVHVHSELAEAYLRAATDLRKKFGISAEPDLVSLMRLPGVVAAAGAGGGGLSEEELATLSVEAAACLEQAVTRLEEMQRAEGGMLVKEMRARLELIGAHAQNVEAIAVKLRPAFAARLEVRLKELIGDGAIDAGRIAQEAALLAERSDTTEELARLASHVEQFGKLLDSQGEIGKKLDFLLQEMQREANTLLSKTNGIEGGGLKITDLGLEIKSEIEKLREQVQNIE